MSAEVIGEVDKSEELDKYTVIIGYEDKDEEVIFSGLNEIEKEKFLEDKTNEVFDYLSKNENDKIIEMKNQNPKLDIIIQKSGNEEDIFGMDSEFNGDSIKLEEYEIAPYAYDTDTYVSTKRFRVTNNRTAFANCIAKVRIDRNLTNYGLLL